LNIPLLEFDPNPEAVIHPSSFVKKMDVPERCIFCFFQEVIKALKDEGRLTHLFDSGSEIGRNPLYELEFKGERVGLIHAGVGAPLSGAFLEEVIEAGCRKFIAIGSAGVLDGKIASGHLVIPTSAVRDEGTSYHYLPPSREVEPSPEAVAAIERVLTRQNIPYILGKTWTTDAPYRETTGKIKLRRAEGCVTVEMEAAAFFAIAKFRNVQFGQILYGGDDVSGTEWDSRGWHSKTEVRRGMLDVALEVVSEM
jgi:uridine phosphorylase